MCIIRNLQPNITNTFLILYVLLFLYILLFHIALNTLVLFLL